VAGKLRVSCYLYLKRLLLIPEEAVNCHSEAARVGQVAGELLLIP
jgi:hypothetical protein